MAEIVEGRLRHRSREIVLSYGAAAFYVAILLLLLLLLWSAKRERESHVRVPDFVAFEQALPSIANLTGSPIQSGNQVTVLQNGDEFFPALLADIAKAEKTVHLETYVWWE